MSEKRFYLSRTAGGASFIRDRKDGRAVCVIMEKGKSKVFVDNIIEVILDSLNGAVERKKEAGGDCHGS